MRRVALSLCVLSLSLPAYAADWLMLQGTEEGRPDEVFSPFGYFQLAVEKQLFVEPVSGLTDPELAPFNGEVASFNNIEEPFELSLRRTRIGARGSITGTDQRINYLVSAEAGFNAFTRDVGVVLMDASVTFNYLPGVRIRVGQMKLPTMDEAIEINPLAHESVQFSPLISELMLEEPVRLGRLTGPAYALRDVGILAFDTFLFADEHFGISYAAMLSQGHKGGLDIDSGKDFTARLELSWLPHGEWLAPFREEVSVFGWATSGEREGEDGPVLRTRAGLGTMVHLYGIRGRFELVGARGMVPAGHEPPFEDEPVTVLENGTAFGWAFHSEVEVFGPFSIDFGADELYRQWHDPAEAYRLRLVSVGAEMKVSHQVRFVGEYTWRALYAPGASRDMQRVLETLGDIVSAQVTVMF